MGSKVTYLEVETCYLSTLLWPLTLNYPGQLPFVTHSAQAGTNTTDDFNAVTVRPDGSILLAGWTDGTWTSSGDNPDSDSDFAAVLIYYGGDISTPSPEPTSAAVNTPSPEHESTSSSYGLSLGAIVGVIAGGAAFVIILGVCVTMKRRHQSCNVLSGLTHPTPNFPVAEPASAPNFPVAAPANGGPAPATHNGVTHDL